MSLFRFKIPNSKDLSRTADSYNRKMFRKSVIKSLRELKTVLKKLAKKGSHQYVYNLSDNNSSFWEYYIVFRWYRMKSKLDVKIEEEVFESKNNKRYVEKISVTIKW